jgi:hypothetical protein
MRPPIIKSMQHLNEQMLDILVSQPSLPDSIRSEEYSRLLDILLDLQRQSQHFSPISAKTRTTQPLVPFHSPQQPSLTPMNPTHLTPETPFVNPTKTVPSDQPSTSSQPQSMSDPLPLSLSELVKLLHLLINLGFSFLQLLKPHLLPSLFHPHLPHRKNRVD